MQLQSNKQTNINTQNQKPQNITIAVAKEYSMPYVETSAATGSNCDEAFEALCREILKKRSK